jgi:hypothetical protein
VGHQHHAAAEALDKGFQFGQPGQVQVVRGFVQEHHIEAAEQERPQCYARGLAAGEAGHGGLRPGFQPEIGQDGRNAFVEVRGAGCHPAVKSEGIGVVGAWGPRTEGFGRGLHVRRRLGTAGAPGDVTGHGFSRHALVFLG